MTDKVTLSRCCESSIQAGEPTGSKRGNPSQVWWLQGGRPAVETGFRI